MSEINDLSLCNCFNFFIKNKIFKKCSDIYIIDNEILFFSINSINNKKDCLNFYKDAFQLK